MDDSPLDDDESCILRRKIAWFLYCLGIAFRESANEVTEAAIMHLHNVSFVCAAFGNSTVCVCICCIVRDVFLFVFVFVGFFFAKSFQVSKKRLPKNVSSMHTCRTAARFYLIYLTLILIFLVALFFE